MAKRYASNRGMKRKVKFAFSFVSAIIQYLIEKKQGKNVPTKTEFVKMYYKQYLELNASQNSGQGTCTPLWNNYGLSINDVTQSALLNRKSIESFVNTLLLQRL